MPASCPENSGEFGDVYPVTMADQQQVGNAVSSECRRRLVDSGFPEHKIDFKAEADSIDAAEDIQLEAGSQEFEALRWVAGTKPIGNTSARERLQ